MNNNPHKKDDILESLIELYEQRSGVFQKKWKRSLPFTEMIVDRWDKAKRLGFGNNASIYDNSLVFGNVTVGSKTWIGPFTILDGSGADLVIGKNCSISAGVHIYTHDSVAWAISGGKEKYKNEKVSIGNCCYIGPYSVITKGVTIGNCCIIGAFSLVNSNIPDRSIAFGQPAQIEGTVRYSKISGVKIKYHPDKK